MSAVSNQPLAQGGCWPQPNLRGGFERRSALGRVRLKLGQITLDLVNLDSSERLLDKLRAVSEIELRWLQTEGRSALQYGQNAC
jgi:hypothetical protein